jgi:HD-like signal output (HDOD) protein
VITETILNQAQALESCRASLRERIELGALKLPVLPRVAGEVMALTNDPNADLSDISELIHRDQSLASHVFRVANSAAFRGTEAIVSLQQALTRLGMSLLGEIAISISLQGEVFRAPGFQKEIKALWRHALASGGWAREIARAKRANVEGQFLCGLLHTVGKPIALQSIVEIQPSLSRDSVLGLAEEFHCTVGSSVAEKWKLPQQVRIACAFYQNYTAAPSFKKETAMTWLANRLGQELMCPETTSMEAIQQDTVVAELNFYPDEFVALLEKREAILAMVNAMDL